MIGTALSLTRGPVLALSGRLLARGRCAETLLGDFAKFHKEPAGILGHSEEKTLHDPTV